VRAAAANPALAQLRLEFNTSAQVVGIAAESLAGHIAAAKGDLETAISHLREAARREDELVYGEPPEWSVPVRQELGLILLRAGRTGEAEQAFAEDLKRFPENVWSLDGMAQALRAQNRTSEAEEVIRRLKQVWSMAHTAPAS
jgi:Flp pilus assembly protein TadD